MLTQTFQEFRGGGIVFPLLWPEWVITFRPKTEPRHPEPKMRANDRN